MSRRNSLVLSLIFALGLPTAILAFVEHDTESNLQDKLYLRNGGVIVGKVDKVEGDKLTYFIVHTSDGAIVRFKNSQVKRVHRPTEKEQQYQSLLSQMEDTLEGHEAMQKWCVENNMRREREYHLKRQIEIDPEYVDARRVLGYEYRDGRWVHREQHLIENGYVKDSRGVYRLPDVIARQEQWDATQQATKDWLSELTRAHRLWVRKKDPKARRIIETATDPLALEGLVRIFEDSDDPSLRLDILEVIGKIQTYGAQNILTKFGMESPDRGIRERCVLLLKQDHYDQSAVVTAVLPFLIPKDDPKTNITLNAAAFFLGEIGHPAAIPALFPALVTRHKLPPPSGNMHMSTDIDGNLNSFGSGQQQPKLVDVGNQNVLDSLRRLTNGADFGFDEDQWLKWYIEKQQLTTTDLRRDE